MADAPQRAEPTSRVGTPPPPIRSRPSTDGDNTEGGTTRDYRMFMAEFLRMRGALNKKLRKEVPSDYRFKPRSGRRRG